MQLPSLSHCSSFCTKPGFKFRVSCSQTTPSINQPNLEAHMDHGLKIYRSVDFPVQKIRGEKGRIKEALLKVDLSMSSYDTAWVAMVPSPRFTKFPCFPECIEWILDNQHPDGSWGLPHGDPSLIKDALSSTLACILALRRWNVGEEHVKRGLRFIGSNFSSIMDKNLQSPIGFNIIFPGMIGYAISMGLNLPVCQSDVDAMFSIRDLELERCYGLLGLNGCGKSTLLTAIGCRELLISEHMDIYHLSQEIEASYMSSLEAVINCDEERMRLEKEAEILAAQDDGGREGLERIYERLEALDAAMAEKRAEVRIEVSDYLGTIM